MPESEYIVVPKEEQEEVKEFISTLMLLTKEDKATLLSNAHAFKIRNDMEKSRQRG